jgi:hypothetical protein
MPGGFKRPAAPRLVPAGLGIRFESETELAELVEARERVTQLIEN